MARRIAIVPAMGVADETVPQAALRGPSWDGRFTVLILFLPPRWRILAGGLWALLTVTAMAGLIDTSHPWSALALSGFNLQFIAGIALAEFRERLSAFRWPALITLVIGAGLAMTWTIRHGLDGLAIADIRVLAFITLAIGLVWTVLAWQPRWHAALTGIGDWSYAIYLGHLLVIGTLARIIGRMAEPGLADRTVGVLDGLGLPTSGLRLDPRQVWDVMARDKKATRDGVRFIISRRPGEAEVIDEPSRAVVDHVLRGLA